MRTLILRHFVLNRGNSASFEIGIPLIPAPALWPNYGFVVWKKNVQFVKSKLMQTVWGGLSLRKKTALLMMALWFLTFQKVPPQFLWLLCGPSLSSLSSPCFQDQWCSLCSLSFHTHEAHRPHPGHHGHDLFIPLSSLSWSLGQSRPTAGKA